MDEKVVRFRVGVLVVTTGLITAILVFMFNDFSSISTNKYTVHVRFDEAPGVRTSTPVRRSGVLIGRVAHVDLDGTQAVIALRIDGHRELRSDEVFQINSSLMGDASLEVIRARQPVAPGTLIKDGGQMRGVAAADPMKVLGDMQGNLTEAIQAVARTATDLSEVAAHINSILGPNEGRINDIIARADSTMASFDAAAASLNSIIGDPDTQEQVRKSLSEMPRLIEDTRVTVQTMNDAMTSVSRNLKNIESITEPLGQKGETIVKRLDAGTHNLNVVMAELAEMAEALNDGEGTLGMLVHNDEIYQRLNRTIKTVDDLTRQLKPIMSDVRVFTDKIARHPGQLGARGVFERSPGIK